MAEQQPAHEPAAGAPPVQEAAGPGRAGDEDGRAAAGAGPPRGVARDRPDGHAAGGGPQEGRHLRGPVGHAEARRPPGMGQAGNAARGPLREGLRRRVPGDRGRPRAPRPHFGVSRRDCRRVPPAGGDEKRRAALRPADAGGPFVDFPKNHAARIRAKFVTLRRDNEKKKLQAELELKMRALYYDVIDPTHVEKYIKAIYQDPRKLEERPEDASGDELPLEFEDIQFLIKNARALLPKTPKEITGHGVRAAVWRLQQELRDEREKCVRAVCGALKTLYADTEPPLPRSNWGGTRANSSSATASRRKRSSPS